MFGCTKCGACCRRIKEAVEGIDFLANLFEIDRKELEFPYKWNEKGECEKLINNMCSVYEQRPLLCNVGELQKLSGIEEKEFFEITKQSCHELMKAERIYEEYKIE